MATARQTLTLLAALSGAIASSQAPEFAQQYRQRMGGAIDELQGVIADFDRDAGQSGLTRQQALETHDQSPARLFRDRGQSMRGTLARYDDLQAQARRFAESPAAVRPLILASDPDRMLMRGAWRDYEPALPLTAHGLIWTAAGFLLGAALARVLLTPFRRRKREPLPRPQMRENRSPGQDQKNSAGSGTLLRGAHLHD